MGFPFDKLREVYYPLFTSTLITSTLEKVGEVIGRISVNIQVNSIVKLTSERHRSAVTHFSEFCKCAKHQDWKIEFVETSAPSVSLSMIEFSSLTNEDLPGW